MENFANEFISKLDGKIPDEALRTVLQELQVFASNYDINQRETHVVPYQSNIPDCYRVYMVAKRIEGMSPESMKTYNFYLTDFFEHINRPFEQVTTNDIRIYLYETQKRTGISNRTLDGKRLVINTFMDWCWKEGYIPNNPCASIKPIKFEEKPREPLSNMELEIVRDACENYRDKAMIELFYSTGCRLSEMVNLKISDIDFTSKEVHLFGKGSKHRTSYLNAKAEYMLKKYFELERPKESISDSVFVIFRKPYNEMHKESIYARVKAIQKRSGIERSLFPHLLRHTMATDALNRGMNVAEVKEILGHEKLDTTMIYAKISHDSVKFNHKRYIV
jgi:site-specific recombinase XerD|nr:MAG TPA: SITE SPECIFIC RECOMBINASE XERD [Caudoviricetes sp.]